MHPAVYDHDKLFFSEHSYDIYLISKEKIMIKIRLWLWLKL